MRQLAVSDTNIWFDFLEIGRLTLPLRLPYEFLMEERVVAEEISRYASALMRAGLVTCRITTDELYFSQELQDQHSVLSVADTIGLAIAAKRKLPLFTGDKRMRVVAEDMGLVVRGTLWILDELVRQGVLDESEYLQCVRDLIAVNNRRRLPIVELNRRLRGGAPPWPDIS